LCVGCHAFAAPDGSNRTREEHGESMLSIAGSRCFRGLLGALEKRRGSPESMAPSRHWLSALRSEDCASRLTPWGPRRKKKAEGFYPSASFFFASRLRLRQRDGFAAGAGRQRAVDGDVDVLRDEMHGAVAHSELQTASVVAAE